MTAFDISDVHTRDPDASLHAARESHRGAAAGTAQHRKAHSDHNPNSHDSTRNGRAKQANRQRAGVDCTSVCEEGEGGRGGAAKGGSSARRIFLFS
jgi:hypothetical protein